VVDGSPTVRRRRLGLILRGLRERAGLTGEEVGAVIERSGSWVSRIETGRVGLRSRDLSDLLSLYKVEDPTVRSQLQTLAREGKRRGWWSQYADAVSGPYATYIGFEADAQALLVYEAAVVNGLLQTEDYARALIAGASLPPDPDDVVERKVKVRMERQELLTQPNPLTLRVILDESVLLRPIGGAEVYRAQLKQLIERSGLPNIAIQVVPFEGAPHPGLTGSFTVVKFPSADDPDIAYIEGASGDIFAESEDALSFNEIFDHLSAIALSPKDTLDKITKFVRSLDHRRAA
jgi:transcriptional regulator with XRE-family HTH domain